MLSDDRDHALAAVSDDAPERRAGKRHQSVLLVGKVRRDGGDEAACLVHDISDRGLMARFAAPPVVGETLWIEVRGLPAMLGTVRWVKGRKAGVQFAEPHSVEQVFRLKRDDGLVARPPRFPLVVPVSVRMASGRFRAETIDISAGGAKLATAHAVEQGETGQVVMIDTGTSLYGKICWVRDGQFGFRFCAPLPLETLGQLLGADRR